MPVTPSIQDRPCEAMTVVRNFFTYISSFCSLILFSFFLSFPLMADKLHLSCPHGKISFKVELAQTPKELAKGLMNREKLDENEGMLFLFPEPHATTMWMKDTLISLDMIFINLNGGIIAIEENTTPNSLKLIGPIDNTAQVLELVAGTVKENRISKECSVVTGS